MLGAPDAHGSANVPQYIYLKTSQIIQRNVSYVLDKVHAYDWIVLANQLKQPIHELHDSSTHDNNTLLVIVF